MKQTVCGLIVFALCLTIPEVLSAQTGRGESIKLYISNAGHKDTLTFGVHEGATVCIDSDLGEEERPPVPPAGILDDRFVGNTSFQRDCMGQGLRISYHPPIGSPPYIRDTFLIKFQPASQDSDYIVRWLPNGNSSMDEILSSCTIKGLDPTPATINMMTTSSFNLTAALGAAADVYPPQYKIFAEWKWPDGIIIGSNNNPSTFSLGPNYPNPFNPTTTLSFSIRENAYATVTVFNVLGQKVVTLVDRQTPPGAFTTQWNGCDDRGMPVSSGVYYVRMNASFGRGESFTQMRKIVLMR